MELLLKKLLLMLGTIVVLGGILAICFGLTAPVALPCAAVIFLMFKLLILYEVINARLDIDNASKEDK